MMADRHSGESRRTAIAGHPLHPLLVPFSIAFLIGTLASDVNFWVTGGTFWAGVSFWMASAGLVTGAAASVVNLIDLLAVMRARRRRARWMDVHGNAIALLLTQWNVLHRVDNPAEGVVPLGLILSAVVVLVLLVTGWLSGELVLPYKTSLFNKTGESSKR
jgi:uncharacterized membrane protein